MKLFSWIKKIDPQSVFDTVASGVDKTFFTNEERADVMKKTFDQYLEWYKQTVNENGSRSLTRRYLAVMFAATFLFLLLASAAACTFSIEYAKFLFDLAKELGPYVGAIMAFYFGYYAVSNVIEAVKNPKKQ